MSDTKTFKPLRRYLVLFLIIVAVLLPLVIAFLFFIYGQTMLHQYALLVTLATGLLLLFFVVYQLFRLLRDSELQYLTQENYTLRKDAIENRRISKLEDETSELHKEVEALKQKLKIP